MALSDVVKNFRDGTLALADGTGTPLDLTVQYEGGDFSVGEFSKNQTEIATYLDRGVLNSQPRKTNQTFPTGSFTAHFTELSDATNETLWDIINATGAFAAAVSTIDANADVYALQLTWTCEGTDFGGGETDHVLVLEDCACTIALAEGDPTAYTITFTCYGTATPT